MQGLKASIKKLFGRRSTHQKLEDSMSIDPPGSPSSPAAASLHPSPGFSPL